MWDIRPIRADEIDKGRQLLSADAAEPNWANAYVLLDGKEIEGVICLDVKLVGLLLHLAAEPLLLKRVSPGLLGLLFWVDGMMRAIASANRQYGYGFAVRDTNAAFQRLVEKRFPVTWQQGNGERMYWRSFT